MIKLVDLILEAGNPKATTLYHYTTPAFVDRICKRGLNLTPPEGGVQAPYPGARYLSLTDRSEFFLGFGLKQSIRYYETQALYWSLVRISLPVRALNEYFDLDFKFNLENDTNPGEEEGILRSDPPKVRQKLKQYDPVDRVDREVRLWSREGGPTHIPVSMFQEIEIVFPYDECSEKTYDFYKSLEKDLGRDVELSKKVVWKYYRGSAIWDPNTREFPVTKVVGNSSFWHQSHVDFKDKTPKSFSNSRQKNLGQCLALFSTAYSILTDGDSLDIERVLQPLRDYQIDTQTVENSYRAEKQLTDKGQISDDFDKFIRSAARHLLQDINKEARCPEAVNALLDIVDEITGNHNGVPATRFQNGLHDSLSVVLNPGDDNIKESFNLKTYLQNNWLLQESRKS